MRFISVSAEPLANLTEPVELVFEIPVTNKRLVPAYWDFQANGQLMHCSNYKMYIQNKTQQQKCVSVGVGMDGQVLFTEYNISYAVFACQRY